MSEETVIIPEELAFLEGDKVSRILDADDIALLVKWSEPFKKFRQFCLDHASSEAFEEVDFTDFSFGFFIALGVSGMTSTKYEPEGEQDQFFDASVLGTLARYVFQYWAWP